MSITVHPEPSAAAADRTGSAHGDKVGTEQSLWAKPAVAPALAGATALLGCVAVAMWNPGDSGGVLTCPTKAALGLDCPFCGGTRAVAQMFRGHLGRAADHNAIVLALAPLAIVVWALWMWSSLTGRPMPNVKARPWHGAALTIVLVIFTVVRNVKPGALGAWLASESSG